MLRYIVVAWNPRDLQESAAAQLVQQRHIERARSWKTLSFPGLFVSYIAGERRGESALLLCRNFGLILGTLFEFNISGDVPPTQCTSIGDAQTDEILQTGGRSIVKQFWGSYVLILRDVQLERVCVMRGPMTQIQCFHTMTNGVNLFFSSMDDFVALGLMRVSVNWDMIQAQAAHGDYLTRETAIKEVSAIECGECVHLTPNGTSWNTYWSPMSNLAREPIVDFATAASCLRASVQYSVSAWASIHDRILHTLSGGLDSSIVLSCLRRAPSDPTIICVNYYSRDSGDERAYAQSMAERSATPLIETERDAQIDLGMVANSGRTARPPLSLSACYSKSTIAQLARKTESTAVFDGELGDNVFGRSGTQEILVEYLVRKGFDFGFLQVALDYARLRRRSVWNTLYLALRDRVFWSNRTFWSGYLCAKRATQADRSGRLLISVDALENYERQMMRFVHPWMTNMVGAPLGKFPFINAIIMVTNIEYQSVFATPTDPVPIAPLTSQPLVEVAMRIPSYMNILQGEDRSVARCAFKSELPDLVLWRGTGKGAADFWIRDTIRRNRRFLQEYLLDGVLVTERILDRSKVESALSADVKKDPGYLNDIFFQLYIEAWLRRWLSSEAQVAV